MASRLPYKLAKVPAGIEPIIAPSGIRDDTQEHSLSVMLTRNESVEFKYPIVGDDQAKAIPLWLTVRPAGKFLYC